MTNSIEAKFKEREEELRRHREHWEANKASSSLLLIS